MIQLHFNKLYSTKRRLEPCQTAVPFKKGECRDSEGFWLIQGKEKRQVQTMVTSRWEDGSIRWLCIWFQADLGGNQAADCYLATSQESASYFEEKTEHLEADEEKKQIKVSGEFVVNLGEGIREDQMIKGGTFCGRSLPCEFPWPKLLERTAAGIRTYQTRPEGWKRIQKGPLETVVENQLTLLAEDGKSLKAEMKLRFFAGKPWVEAEYRLVNASLEPLDIQSLTWALPCGKEQLSQGKIRTMTGISNYRTQFQESSEGERVRVLADADLLMNTANEHFAEVFFGTMFCSRSAGETGLTATIWQAQQNFPKAAAASGEGLEIDLVPEGKDKVVMQPGMARTQRVLLHFHGGSVPKEELAERSTIYQMPDKCVIDPEIYRKAGVFEDVFLDADKKIPRCERVLRARADSHSRCYGMLNWGDSPDPGYTRQRRGGDEPVWTNNEYDYPHACFLLYARTGARRFLDYGLVAADHWMDVDVCHYSDDPLLFEGQWEHTRRHTADGVIVCSHQWVEGLLDTWHFTGNHRALETALGIGRNVLRLLETPMFHQKGGINARETGWALRTLSALYKETNDPKWLEKCQWIVGHFTEWKEEYGQWLSPYLDNTFIHVVFMISIAAGSLMRYYRIRPDEHVRQMIVDAVEDMVDNCMLEDGTFYYKELPSLARSGNNPLIMEALVYAWELTGDRKYLEAGKVTFENTIEGNKLSVGGTKTHVNDAVIQAGDGTKTFAQSFLPLAIYYKAAAEEGIIK